MNPGVHVSFLISVFKFLDKYPGEELLGHIVVLFLTFWGVSILLSIAIAPIYLPTNGVLGFYLSTSLPTLVICCLFNNSHLIGVIIMVSICVFLMISDVEHLFIYLLAICESLFVKKSIRSVCCSFLKVGFFFFFFWLLSCMSSLYTCVPIHYQIYGLQIFPPIPQVVFSFGWWFPLLCRSTLIWSSPTCLFLLLLLFLLVSNPKKIISKTSIKEFTTMLISLILFEFIFMYGVR